MVSIRFLYPGQEFRNDVLYPEHVEPGHIAYHGLGAVLQYHPSEVVNRLAGLEQVRADIEAILGSKEGNPRVLSLFQDPLLLQDSLGSLLGGARAAALKPIVGDPLAERFSEDILHQQVAMSIQSLQSDPLNAMCWLQLMAIVRGAPLYPDLAQDFAIVTEKIDLSELLTHDPFTAIIAGHLIAQFLATYSIRREWFIGEMVDIARQLDDDTLALPVATQEDQILTEAKLIGKLVDWSYLLCAGHENHLAREGMLAETLERLMRTSARIADHLRPLLSNLARWLHTGRHPGLDRTVLVSRARP